MSLECLCVKNTSGKLTSTGGVVKARLSLCPLMVKAKLEGVGSIFTGTLSKQKTLSAKLEAVGRFSAEPKVQYGLGFCELCECCGVAKKVCRYQNLTGKGFINTKLTLRAALNTKIDCQGSFSTSYTDKFSGSFCDILSSHKMYPILDVSSVGMINDSGRASPLFSSVDEGVFTGFYHKRGETSHKISDDNTTYIQPSSVHTEGTFSYKCGVTKPTTWLKDSRLHIRAAAPLRNYESKGPPQYKIHNIKLEDPSGDLITQYEDITIRGDADFRGRLINFATYGSKSKSSPAAGYQWESGYPRMHEPSGYTLSFDIDSTSLDDPFDTGYDGGFEDTAPFVYEAENENDHLALDGSPMSTRSQNILNPTDSLRISAIEISNCSRDVTFPGLGPAKENMLNFMIQITPTGNRLERTVLPTEFKLSSFDTGIHPEKHTVWSGYNLGTGYSTNNTVVGGSMKDLIRNNSTLEYISLESIPVSESGKLTLKFGHEKPNKTFGFVNGEFSIGVPISGAFNTAYESEIRPVDHFFPIDSISLKVLARKAAGALDYPIDVVGYSDDKLLNITSAVGGFLQNPSGDAGSIPSVSGFSHTDDLGISTESVSEKDQYFLSSGTNNSGGDHYLVSSDVVSNTGPFVWYDIPLKIYQDDVKIGELYDYSQSSYFENIYLDIYPLPSGAEISALKLSINYTPSNALQMHTVGGKEIGRIQKGRSEGKFYPASRQSGDSVINTGSGYVPISHIWDGKTQETMPHAYATESTPGYNSKFIKSNYSRRWRGMEGTVNGPFDPNEFAFGFENPLVDFPFLSGYYDFDYDDGLTIKSRPLGDGLGSLTGTLSTTYEDYRFKNDGWRFISGVTLFEEKLPGYSGNYKTTDWTSLENGVNNFTEHELYGQIADAFNNTVRISGENSNINFGQIDTASGFAVFARFTPDCDMSGVSYNLWDSGVLVSKWDNGKNLEFALGYEGGYICGFAKDNAGNIVKVKDGARYDEYQYPLSVILTYNDHQSSGLKLYTDNEFSDGSFTNLRDSSSEFTINTGTSDLVLGYSSGSGVGINAFVSEFGISTYGASGTNIVESDPNLLYKEVTGQKFLENHRMKLWDASDDVSDDTFKLWGYVDEDTEQWDLGAFKYCDFGPDFDWMTKRVGRDLIGFNIVHEGSGYLQKTDISAPSTLPFSGIAYHTQVENDFLRFNLSNSVNSFYSIAPRISKTLPRGYSFKEDAIVVDSIIEHASSGDIQWDDGNVGPKLIVSLYTRNKDPWWAPSYLQEGAWDDWKGNWGLINRSIHYLSSHTCFERVESKFDFDSFMDTTELWALFPEDRRITEFNHKYYSDDVDKMFLQYDLVYPSGSAFTSRLNLHSAHVRLTDPFIKYVEASGSLNIAVSGEKRERESLNLSMLTPIMRVDNGVSGLPLFTLNLPTGVSGQMNLYTSGNYWKTETLPLVIPTVYPNSGSLNLYTSGLHRITENLNLTAFNTSDWEPYPSSLFLNTFGSSYNTVGIYDEFNLFALGDDNAGVRGGFNTSSINLVTVGKPALQSRYSGAAVNLFIDAPLILKDSMPMTLYGKGRISEGYTSSNLGMFTSSYSSVGAGVFFWNGNDYGQDIDVLSDTKNDDEFYTSKLASDEIRGVTLMGYGSCSSDSPKKIVRPPTSSHGTNWASSGCIEAGIARAHSTYTNLDVGYSGNYYNITKYNRLIPDTVYNVTIQGKTGTGNRIELPRMWEEWEYGICGPSYDALSCCGDEGCEEDIAFSGVKFVGDYPHMSGEPSLTPDSGRNAYDKYGHSVAVDNDLMAISAPLQEIADEDGSGLQDAGSIFLYRRQDQAYSGQKAPWHMSQKLMLPSGFRGDYSLPVQSAITFKGMPIINDRKWQVGQEGREFGHSLDVTAGSGDSPREIVVVGAPGAKWGRTFEEIETSGVPVGVLVVSDEFSYGDQQGAELEDEVRYWDKLYKYYASHPAELDLKITVCQPTGIFGEIITQQGLLPDFINHGKIGRRNTGVSDDAIFSGIKAAFHEAWPYDASKTHNNIPAIFGIYVDVSRSLGRHAVEPAIDRFKDYYLEYSYLSGVHDFYGVQSAGYLHEHFPGAADDTTDYHGGEKTLSEDWVGMSKKIINDTLDTGRLIENNALRFITSGIGIEYVNLDATAFNIPPDSGGRVYVFEKDGDSFSLIQEIASPSKGSWHIPDRFGHSVGVSKDSSTITIGSPYITESCLAYEYDESAKTGMYKGLRGWLDGKGSFSQELERLTAYEGKLGKILGAKKLYGELDASGQFSVRQDLNIQEYRKMFSYGTGDISYNGNWRFLIEKYAPKSRLGYSTAVSEDGSTIAFGAPTDSFNEFDDLNVWYNNDGDTKDGKLPSEGLWASHANAGAVRVFDSRAYHQHDKVVEFTKFGNLDRNSHTVNGVEPAHYTDLNNVFSGHRKFERTAYTDLEIPTDAGLAFIISPQIDATSDIIIDNIKNWLALGDRTLVLVGNDPVWEEGGRYKESNELVNKILSRLDSRMRIHPARNKSESLPVCANDDFPNVTRAHRPTGSRKTRLDTFDVYAKGVGDIRMHMPDFGTMPSPCESPLGEFEDRHLVNDKCNMWLQNNGDMRAEWNEVCIAGSKCDGHLVYQRNWSMEFGTSAPDCCHPGPVPAPKVNKPGQEPLAILVAAEYLQPRTETIPGYDGYYKIEKECEEHYITIKGSSKYLDFSDTHVDELSFVWSESNFDGVSRSIDRFDNPAAFEDRDALLYKTAQSIEKDPQEKKRDILNPLPLVGEETVGDSKVVMIATVLSENERSLTHENDETISFYLNLVQRSCNSGGKILQLGGWTGRTKFTDAYANSLLEPLFRVTGNGVTENWKSNLPITHNVAWVANSSGLPSEAQATDIKNWLNTGGKTLVITYDSDLSSVRNAHNICRLLNLKMQPVFSESENEYKKSVLPMGSSQYVVDPENSSIKGCSEKEKVSAFSVLSPSYDERRIASHGDTLIEEKPLEFYPVQNSKKVIWILGRISETYHDPVDPLYCMKTGVATASFDVSAGSGYRIFYSWVSETPSETQPLDFYVSGVSQNADLSLEHGSANVYDLDANLRLYPRYGANIKADMDSVGTLGFIKEGYVDVRVPEDISRISLLIEGNNPSINNPDNKTLKTTRFLSASGCPLPIVERVKTYEHEKYSHETCVDKKTWVPPTSETTKEYPAIFRPIKTDDSKYCSSDSCLTTYGDKEIEDGPVVVAEEIEHFSSFSAGAKRSTIVVISDSSMVQGDCDFYRARNEFFIRDLYPTSPVSVVEDESLFQGRKFSLQQKLLAPDRGSAGKFRAAASGLSNINSAGSGLLAQRFNGDSYSAASMGSFDDIESNYTPGQVLRMEEPTTEEGRKMAIDRFRSQVIPSYGATPLFSGGIAGYEDYRDATIGEEGMPRIMKETGYDYLDFDQWPSGYPGDLFGFSIDLHRGRLVVGAPFNGFDGENHITWSGIKENPSGLKISGNGGAGAAYYFEKTNNGVNAEGEELPWEYIRKIKPSSINSGHDGWTDYTNPDADDVLGTNDYRVVQLADAYVTDQFGYDVSMDEDFIAIGAPGHDFDVHHEHIYGRSVDGISYDGSFIRKEFDFEFDIPLHNVHDLGSSGARDAVPSGTVVLNNGAIYTYVYDVVDSGQRLKVDWPNREKSWTYAEKVMAQGYKARAQFDRYDSGGGVVAEASGSENDHFGRSIAIDRSYRGGDADYTLVGGAVRHKYGISGGTDDLINAGAAYSFDAMLRRQTPAIGSSGGYVQTSTGLTGSGGMSGERISLYIPQSAGPDKTYQTSGLILSNYQGEIFLETSGYDPSVKGFTQHRPYVQFVHGSIALGTPSTGYFGLYTSGMIPQASSVINMNILSQPTATVYNSVGLNTTAVLGIASGVPSGLFLHTLYDPTSVSGTMNLFASGIVSSGDSLNLAIRGK
jgi:hypothetical protein